MFVCIYVQLFCCCCFLLIFPSLLAWCPFVCSPIFIAQYFFFSKENIIQRRRCHEDGSSATRITMILFLFTCSFGNIYFILNFAQSISLLRLILVKFIGFSSLFLFFHVNIFIYYIFIAAILRLISFGSFLLLFSLIFTFVNSLSFSHSLASLVARCVRFNWKWQNEKKLCNFVEVKKKIWEELIQFRRP